MRQNCSTPVTHLHLFRGKDGLGAGRLECTAEQSPQQALVSYEKSCRATRGVLTKGGMASLAGGTSIWAVPVCRVDRGVVGAVAVGKLLNNGMVYCNF